ncbi:MAG: FtsX-like permease family protein, partial [Firmicutes bacterium]|nr:FtsX-like permease family protein [Bacillota bacterium]
ASRELRAARRKLDDAKQELDDAASELADAKQELDDALVKLEDGERDYAEGLAKYEDGEAEYADGLAEYEDGLKEYEDGKQELIDGEAEYAKGLREYREKSQEAAETIADAEADIAKAEKDLTEGQEKVDDAKQDLADLKEPTTFVLGRDTNIGYSSLSNDTAIVKGIAKVFPLFFFLVAVLVCITTMTRMVDEQRTENGTLKALGFKDGAIIGRYLLYAGTASLLGCFSGFFIGSKFMPTSIWKIYRIMYAIDRPVALLLDWKLFAVCTVLYILCALGATWLSCRKELNEPAAELIRPKAPEPGKRVLLERIPFLWRRLSFLRKVSVRNILLYKKRMIMMIIGIGGCTALLLTGFGIRDTIRNIVDFQYEEISLYDGIVSFFDEQTPEDRAAFRDEFRDTVGEAAFASISAMDVVYDGSTEANIVVFREPLDTFVDLHEGDRKIGWPGEGEAVLDYRLANERGLSVGDTFRLTDDDLNTLEVTVSGIFDNYLYDYVFVAAETFERAWGSSPAVKSCYIDFADGVDIHAGTAKLLSSDGISAVSLAEDFREMVGSLLSSMDLVVLIVLVCSGALAFIVLYNLTNISITERKREIATLKVLGFYQIETSRYVFRENLILTGVASLVGIPLGILLLRYVMDQVTIQQMYFGCRLEPLSYVLAVAITFVFAILIDLVLRRKIAAVDMAESMKAIE